MSEEELGFIDTIEIKIDYGNYISKSDFDQYLILIEKRNHI